MTASHHRWGALWLGLAGCAGPVVAPVATSGDSAPTAGERAPLILCINEFVADNQSGWQDGSGAFADWVELHNPGPDPISLDGWHMSDDPDDLEKHALDASLAVEAGGFLLLVADGQGDLGPEHLSFSLAAEGEAIGIFRADGVGELLTFDATLADFSWARQPDCCVGPAQCAAATWLGSPGVSNGS